MDSATLLAIVRNEGALVEDDHFVFQKGEHSDSYFNFGAVIGRPGKLRQFAHEIAQRFLLGYVHSVVGPATGGAQLAQLIALELEEMSNREILVGIADKDGKELVFKRGYENACTGGKRVLVVDDTITTGDTLERTIALSRQYGGEVVGVAAAARRKKEVTAVSLGVPKLTFELDLDLPSWSEAECPYCHDPARQRRINTKLGHGAAFLRAKRRRDSELELD